MRGITIPLKFLGTGGAITSCLLLMVSIHGCKQETSGHVTKLKKISAFKVEEKLLQKFIRGQLSICREQPESEVRIYPTFKSDKPLYGLVRFAAAYGQDESGILYHFAVDESHGTGKGYDRLYFDLNRDLNLADEESQAPLKSPPTGATLKNPNVEQQVCFHYLPVVFEDSTGGQCLLEIMPRLMIYKSGHANLSFVTTEARKGKIRIASHRYDVLLGHNYLVSGSFNRPWTALNLIPEGNIKNQLQWQGADRLMAIHKIEGRYYCFSATPAGDKLKARPYNGKFGTFMGGSGKRDLIYIGCNGSLFSKDKAVAIGNIAESGWTQPSYESQIPVGDYLPSSLSIQYDKLSIYLSDNYHDDGKPLSRASTDKKFGIKIREDEPFVFDFANEPEVMFALPVRDYRIKPGDELTVKAILIDPKLDIMIRRLTDLSRKEKQEEDTADGRKRTVWRDISLDPTVIITRANGEKVAEGVMPFG
jgi:hypothetical protein